jgi:hypothetical protein
MKRVIVLAMLLVLSSCDYREKWRDGPYGVLWIDTENNRTLSYDLGDNASIDRVEAEVIAVGSNEKYIVAKQKDVGNDLIAYYFIEREKDNRYYNGSEITQGPFTESSFLKLKSELGLPEFTEEF